MPDRNPNTLTDTEFWTMMGLYQAHGGEGAAKILRVTKDELRRAVWEGLEIDRLDVLRESLSKQTVRSW